MEHLKHLLEGARRALVIYSGEDYIRPHDGFARDAEVLRGDARRVAAGLNRVTQKHDQPLHDGKA